MLSNLMKKISQVFLVYLLTWGLIFPSFIFAADLPTGGTITGGQATITTGATNLDIDQSSNRAVSEWNNFSIGNGFTVNVNQCPTCAHLAMDVGGDISSIYGTLNAQGAFWLSNSRGIYVGQSGVFNVGNLLLSTLNISGQDFMAGNFHFAQDPNSPLAYIFNKGTINAANGGYAALIAPSIINEGIIGANLGKVYGIAGEEAVLNFGGDSLIGFTVDGAVTDDIIGPDGNPVSANIMNNGIIQANGGEVVLKANTAYGVIKSVVNNSGVIEARSFTNSNGKIVLDGGDSGIVENNGIITASAAEAGADGGDIQISGDVISNAGTITADAGDNATAGNIDVIADSLLTLEGTSRLSARGADVNSDGGDIYLWSDDDAFALAGQVIDISGGTTSGNGGTAELSSGDYVSFDGSILGYSQGGQQGSFIIDPPSASISGNIAANTTVWAQQDITITGNVTVDTSGGSVALYLLADHDDFATFPLPPNPGDWQPGGGYGTIQNSGGNWTISEIGFAGTSTVHLYASDFLPGNDIIGTDLSPIDLRGINETVIAVRNDPNGSNGNNVFLAGDDLVIRGDLYLGNLDLETTGTITQTAALTSIATLDINAGGAVTLSDAGNDVQTLTAVTSNAAINFRDTDDFAITTVNAGANTVTLTSGNGISDGGGAEPNITATTLTVLGNSTFGMGDTIETAVSTLALTTANTYIDNTGALTINDSTVGGALTITNSSSIALNNVDAGGFTVNLTAGGAITDANGGNNITAGTLNIFGNSVGVGNAIETTVSNLTLTTAATNISNTGALTVYDSTVTGQLDLAGNAGIALYEITATGQTVNLNAGGAITDLNGGPNNVTAGSASFRAVTGVGTAANAIETDVDNLAAAVSGAGDIYISNTGGTNITTINGVTGLSTNSSDINIQDTSTITVSSVVNAASDGDVTLHTTSGNIAINDNVKSSAGAGGTAGDGTGIITIDTDNGSLTTDGTGTIMTNGTFYLDTIGGAGGAIGTGANYLSTSGTGSLNAVNSGAGNDIFITHAGNLNVNDITSIDDINLTTTGGGNINDNDPGTAITGDLLTLNAGGGIGTADTLNVSVNSLSISGAGGAVDITNANAAGSSILNASMGAQDFAYLGANNLIVASVTADDVIIKTTGGSIQDDADGAVDLTANRASLSATAGIGDFSILETNIDQLAAASTTAGNIVIWNTGGTTIQNLSGMTVGSLTGVSGLSTTASDITIEDTSTVTVAALTNAQSDGNVSIHTTSGNVAINANVQSSAAASVLGDGTGAITIDTDAGAITNAGGDIIAYGAGGSAVLNATTGIDADTNVIDVTATNSTSGNIIIDETNALDIIKVEQTNQGSITVTSGGTMTVTAGGTGVFIDDAGNVDANNDITLQATAGNIVIDNIIYNDSNNAGADIIFTANTIVSQDIIFSGAGDIRAGGTAGTDSGDVNMDATGTITQSGTGDIITRTSGTSGTGDVYINATGGFAQTNSLADINSGDEVQIGVLGNGVATPAIDINGVGITAVDDITVTSSSTLNIGDDARIQTTNAVGNIALTSTTALTVVGTSNIASAGTGGTSLDISGSTVTMTTSQAGIDEITAAGVVDIDATAGDVVIGTAGVNMTDLDFEGDTTIDAHTGTVFQNDGTIDINGSLAVGIDGFDTANFTQDAAAGDDAIADAILANVVLIYTDNNITIGSNSSDDAIEADLAGAGGVRLFAGGDIVVNGAGDVEASGGTVADNVQLTATIGSVLLSSTGGLMTTNGGAFTGSGSVIIDASSAIDIDSTNAGAFITSDDDVLIGQLIPSSTVDISGTVTAGDLITIDASSNITIDQNALLTTIDNAQTGTIDIGSTGGAINLNNTAQIDANNDDDSANLIMAADSMNLISDNATEMRAGGYADLRADNGDIVFGTSAIATDLIANGPDNSGGNDGYVYVEASQDVIQTTGSGSNMRSNNASVSVLAGRDIWIDPIWANTFVDLAAFDDVTITGDVTANNGYIYIRGDHNADGTGNVDITGAGTDILANDGDGDGDGVIWMLGEDVNIGVGTTITADGSDTDGDVTPGREFGIAVLAQDDITYDGTLTATGGSIYMYADAPVNLLPGTHSHSAVAFPGLTEIANVGDAGEPDGSGDIINGGSGILQAVGLTSDIVMNAPTAITIDNNTEAGRSVLVYSAEGITVNTGTDVAALHGHVIMYADSVNDSDGNAFAGAAGGDGIGSFNMQSESSIVASLASPTEGYVYLYGRDATLFDVQAYGQDDPSTGRSIMVTTNDQGVDNPLDITVNGDLDSNYIGGDIVFNMTDSGGVATFGDLTQAPGMQWTSAGTILFDSAAAGQLNDVVLQGSITTTEAMDITTYDNGVDTGDVTLNTAGTILIGGTLDITSTNGTISQSNGTVQTDLGAIRYSADTINLTGGTTYATGGNPGTGFIAMTSTGVSSGVGNLTTNNLIAEATDAGDYAIKLTAPNTGTVTVGGTVTATAIAGLTFRVDPGTVVYNNDVLVSGDITAWATGNIDTADGVELRSTGGDIFLYADNTSLGLGSVDNGAGDFTAGSGSVIRADAGNVEIAGENVTVYDVQAEESAGTITIESDRSDAVAGDGDVNVKGDVRASAVSIEATGGDIVMDSGTSIAATNGNATLSAFDMTLNDVSQLTGNISITSDNNMALNGAINNEDRDVALEATGGAISSGVNGMVTGDAVDLAAGLGITANTTATTLEATATGGIINITETDGVAISAGGISAGGANAIALTAGGDIDLTGNAINGNTTVDVTSQNGSITDSIGGGNITASTSIALSAATGIDVDTNTGSIEAVNTASGNINITELAAGGDLTIYSNGVTNAGNGTVTINVESGSLTVDAGIAAGGNVEADATSDLNVNSTVTSTAGSIDLASSGSDINVSGGSLNAATAVILDANQAVDIDTVSTVTAGAYVDITANNGDVTINDSTVNAGDYVYLEASSDVFIENGSEIGADTSVEMYALDSVEVTGFSTVKAGTSVTLHTNDDWGDIRIYDSEIGAGTDVDIYTQGSMTYLDIENSTITASGSVAISTNQWLSDIYFDTVDIGAGTSVEVYTMGGSSDIQFDNSNMTAGSSVNISTADYWSNIDITGTDIGAGTSVDIYSYNSHVIIDDSSIIADGNISISAGSIIDPDLGYINIVNGSIIDSDEHVEIFSIDDGIYIDDASIIADEYVDIYAENEIDIQNGSDIGADTYVDIYSNASHVYLDDSPITAGTYVDILADEYLYIGAGSEINATGSVDLESTNSWVEINENIVGNDVSVIADNDSIYITSLLDNTSGGYTFDTGGAIYTLGLDLDITAEYVTALSDIYTTGLPDTNGGNVSITTTAGDIDLLNVTTDGGPDVFLLGGYNAGDVTLNSAGDLTVGDISAQGSDAGVTSTFSGGAGGSVSITADAALAVINVSDIDTTGGAGDGAGAAGTGGNIDIMGDSATVNHASSFITGGGDLTVEAGVLNIDVVDTTGLADQAGGNVILTSTIGDITMAGNITTDGGIATVGAGQNAGSVDITSANNLDMSVSDISAQGSDAFAASGAAGGSGADVTITALTGLVSVQLSNIDTTGGAGDGGGFDGAGGSVNVAAYTALVNQSGTITTGGGNVEIDSILMNVDTIDTTGGEDQNGGYVDLHTNVDELNVVSITTDGGVLSALAGTNAGTVTLDAATDLTTGDISAQGAGTGTGGNVTITAEDTATVNDINASAGVPASVGGDISVTADTVVTNALTDIMTNASVDIAGTFGVDLNGTIGSGTAIGTDVTLTSANGIVDIGGNVTANNNVTVNAGSNVTVGAVTITADNNTLAGGSVSLNADFDNNSAGNVNLADGSIVIGETVTLTGVNIAADVVTARNGAGAAVTVVTITGDENVTLNDTVTVVSAVDGDIDVTATAGNISQTAGQVIANNGGVRMTAGGNIDVINIVANANNFGTDAIKLTADGNVGITGTGLDAVDVLGENLNISIDPVDVTIGAAVTASGDVTVVADNNITVTATVTADSDNDDTGNANLTADNDSSSAGDFVSTGATIVGENVTIGGYNVAAGTLTGEYDGLAGNGSVTVNAQNNATMNGAVTAGQTTGTIDINAVAGNAVTTAVTGTLDAGGAVTVDAGLDVTIAATVVSETGTIGITATDGNVTTTGAGATLTANTLGGTVTVTSGNSTTIGGIVSAADGVLVNAGNNLAINNNIVADFVAGGPGDASLNADTDSSSGGDVTMGNVLVTGQNVTVTGYNVQADAITADVNATITAQNDVQLDDAYTATAGIATVTGGRNVTSAAAG
ncbi:MAG: hypothetical protein Q7U10_05345, partial [Thermodesulfovibrionia bacterium]|nr:hypothetical protein [Thermodesulfovibrionia bacterium]